MKPKAKIIIIVVLVGVFGFLIYNKVRGKKEIAPPATIEAAKDTVATLPPAIKPVIKVAPKQVQTQPAQQKPAQPAQKPAEKPKKKKGERENLDINF